MPRILFVSGFHPSTRARDLAFEFERYGPLVRCDVPAPRNPLRRDDRPTYHERTPHTLPVDVDFSYTRVVSRPLLPPSHTPIAQHSFAPISSYAFVEFRSTRDAEDAYNDMHGRNLDGHRLSIQWAKNPPSSVWRYDRRSRSPPPAYRSSRDRSRSPRRRVERDRDERDYRGDDRRRRSRSPVPRRRSPSPERRGRDDRERERERPRTPPPVEDVRKEEDKSQTPPPYDR